jgi:hypothetical protein
MIVAEKNSSIARRIWKYGFGKGGVSGLDNNSNRRKTRRENRVKDGAGGAEICGVRVGT